MKHPRACAAAVVGMLLQALTGCVQSQQGLVRDLAQQRLWLESSARLQSALRQDPNNPQILHNLSVCFEALGQSEKAKELADQARAAAQGDPRQGFQSWPVEFPVVNAAREAALKYNSVAVLPILALGGDTGGRDGQQFSDYVQQVLSRRAPFRVLDQVLELEPDFEARGPLVLDDQTVDGVLLGRFRFSRRDRSAWDTGSERTTLSQGQPIFVRRTAFRLELWIELRNLAGGRVDLKEKFTQEILFDGDALGEEREAFNALMGAATNQLMLKLDPPPTLEQRVMLDWRTPAQQGSP